MEHLLVCLRAWFDPARVTSRPEFSLGNPDWGRFEELAVRHGVVPIVHTMLARARTAAPHKVLGAIQSRFRMSTGASLYQAGELVTILGLLASAYIRALALKGPAFAVAAYGKVAWRESCDLDILISESDVERAAAVLAARGYRSEINLFDRGSRAVIRADKDVTLTSESSDIELELHWRLTKPEFPVGMTFDELWLRRVYVQLPEGSVPTLDPEHTIIYLCVHGTTHCWSSLKWICDIAQFVRVHGDLCWSGVLSRARTAGALRMLLVGLDLARRVVGMELPAEVMRALDEDSEAIRLSHEAMERLARDSSELRGTERTLTQIRYRERFLDRARLFCYLLARHARPNSSDHGWLRLPRPLFGLYYLVRPLRLMSERWREAIRPALRNLAGILPRGLSIRA